MSRPKFTRLKIERVAFGDGVDVAVPIFVKQLQGLVFSEIADMLNGLENRTPKEQAQAMAELCYQSVCDQEGELLFESAEEVLDEPFGFMEACGEMAMVVNGLAPDSVEEEVKNS